ncbi:hypothetical protein BASA81_000157 [Batrachochytrium salamandrivorans]|nr:hypothetical protein BASA81_000157 [Batrachochytrium salamandrivorans]
MLGFFDSIKIPIDEQVHTWMQLKKGNIFQLKHLAHQSQEALESLGIKHTNAAKIVNGKPAEYEYMPTKLQASTVKRNSFTAPAAATAAAAGTRASLPRPAPPVVVTQRLSKFVKGDRVEHFREADQLIRKGKIVGVHLDPHAETYYTMALDDGNELQCVENKLQFNGGWETKLEEKRKEDQLADEDLL